MKKPVDLVLIGGDFQAVRAYSDLECMSVPVKYRQLGDFHKYYEGKAKAPYLTIFIGGNHEASNYLQELYYGGWVAPNIYYLGASGMVTYKNVLKIAGLSGIYNARDYHSPRVEKVPFTPHSVRSIYHIRKHEVDKLKLLKNQRIDLMMSHDWPAGIERYGNLKSLLQKKKFFKEDIDRGQLGSPPAMEVLKAVRPGQWLSAHLHVRYTATLKHESVSSKETGKNADEIVLDGLDDLVSGNTDEIVLEDLDLNNKNSEEIDLDMGEEFTATTEHSADPKLPGNDFHTTSYKETRFLALDKCMPRRAYLEYLTITVPEVDENEANSKKRARRQSDNADGFASANKYHSDLSYDAEWLAITRTMNQFYPHRNETQQPDFSAVQEFLQQNRVWVKQNIVDKNILSIPLNFQYTSLKDKNFNHGKNSKRQGPSFYRNHQTDHFCSMLEITNQVLVQQGANIKAAKPETQPAVSIPEKPSSAEYVSKEIPLQAPVSVSSLPAKPVARQDSAILEHSTPKTTNYPTYDPSSDDEETKPESITTPIPFATPTSTDAFKETAYAANSSDSE